LKIDMKRKWEGNNRIKLSFKPNVEQSAKIAQLESSGVKVEYEYEIVTKIDTEDVKGEFNAQDILGYFDQWCKAEKIGKKEKELGLKYLTLDV